MKRSRRISIVIGLLVLAAALAGGASAFSQDRETAQQQEVAVEPTTAAPAQAQERAVIAKGVVTPLQHAALSMAAGGVVSEILVKEGEPVEMGQVILRLQSERQQAAVAEADAAVATANAQLALLKAGSPRQSVAAAQAGVDAAKARVERLSEGGRTGDVAAARAALDAARAGLARVQQGPDKNLLIAAQADLANAQAAVRSAQAAYDQVKDRNDVGMLPQSLQLEQATNALSAAQARYDELMAPPPADRVAQAAAGVKQAHAELDRVLEPATAAALAEADAMVRQAEAQLGLLTAGARAPEIAAAEAAVAQAEAARLQALAALRDTELRAPFSAILAVMHLRAGEQVAPGQPVAEIGDITEWRVETDDLSELDVVRVQPGQEVSVTFEAMPELSLTGTIERLQPKGEKKLGDMTYTVLVRLNETHPGLLWNMTAVVNLP
jgi:HlyD family secretion protein